MHAKHMWRIVRNGNTQDYYFVCSCQKRKLISREAFWGWTA